MEKEQKYLEILNFYKKIDKTNQEQNTVTKAANLLNLLKEKFTCFNWIGFYLLDDKKEQLYLGPFIGSLAANTIPLDRGVCGYCARQKASVVVEDVSKFEGHIACSLTTKSEICVPIKKSGKLIGLLDIDSNSLANFDDIDKKYLEAIISQIFE
ncbi:MAG: GAF domain-containing protein [Bacilli bacterium]